MPFKYPLAHILIARNLNPGVHATTCHRCTTITEFASEAFNPPAGDAPLIERVEVQAVQAMDDQIERINRIHDRLKPKE